MNIRVTLRVEDQDVKHDVLEIADHKLDELTDEDIEAAIEIVVREWVNRLISVAWETEESPEV